MGQIGYPDFKRRIFLGKMIALSYFEKKHKKILVIKSWCVTYFLLGRKQL